MPSPHPSPAPRTARRPRARLPLALFLPALFLPALILGAPALGTGTLQAQEHAHGSHDHTSPYAEFGDREIKALSADEMAGLEAGAGLGMALPAELNGYPGPKHVLEMAPMLNLSAQQRADVQAVFDEMEADARRLGARIIELERELDQAFARGTIDPARLRELTEAIGMTRAQLRAVHLSAHLELVPVLTDAQRARYNQARGYGEGAGG